MPGGVQFSEELFQGILNQIAEGKSLASILRQVGMPSYVSVMDWIKNSPDLANRYARAKEESAEALAEQIMDLADEDIPVDEHGRMDSAAVNRQRLRVDARKWVAAKLKPKKYGDKVQNEHTGDVTILLKTGVPRKQDEGQP